MTDDRTLTTAPPQSAAGSPAGSTNGRADDLAATAGLSPGPVPRPRHVPLVQELADELRTLRSSFEGVRFLMRDTEAQLNAVQARLQQLGREATALAPATRVGSAPVAPPFPEHDDAPGPSAVVHDTVALPVVLRDAIPASAGGTAAPEPADAGTPPVDEPAVDPSAAAVEEPSAPQAVTPPAAEPATAPPPGAATPYVPNPTIGVEPTADVPVAPASPAADPAPVDPSPAPIADAPPATPAPQPAPAAGNLEEMARARLVALTMAANQATPDEIERHLRDDLGIADPSVLVDYVFGTGTPDSVVPGWPPQGGR